MLIIEVQHDLFTIPKDYVLMHCISADLALGAGIARTFAKLGVKDCLQAWYADPEIGSALVTQITGWQAEISLVTKAKYWQKPTYESLKRALINAKASLHSLQATKLAMPRIGCGLDKLQWNSVRGIIEEVFADTNMQIVVCVL